MLPKEEPGPVPRGGGGRLNVKSACTRKSDQLKPASGRKFHRAGSAARYRLMDRRGRPQVLSPYYETKVPCGGVLTYVFTRNE